MTLRAAVRWIKLAVLVLEALLGLLRNWRRLRREANEAIDAAGLAYMEAWEALEDRDLTREEVAGVRKKLEAFGQETEDVLQVLAAVLSLKEEDP